MTIEVGGGVMKKAGFVTALQKDSAVVRLARHSACSECGACHHGGEAKDIVIEAKNPAGAQVGDQVLVDLESIQIVRAASLFYGVPLLALLTGVFISKALLDYLGVKAIGDLISAGIGLLAMVAVFVAIRINEPKLKQSGRYTSVITEICNKDINQNKGDFEDDL